MFFKRLLQENVINPSNDLYAVLMIFPVTSMTFSSIAPVHKYAALVLGAGMFSSVPFSIIEPSCNYSALCWTAGVPQSPGLGQGTFRLSGLLFLFSDHLFDW